MLSNQRRQHRTKERIRVTVHAVETRQGNTALRRNLTALRQILRPRQRHRLNIQTHLNQRSHHLRIHLLRSIHPRQRHIGRVVTLNHLIVVPSSRQQRARHILITVRVILRIISLNTERRRNQRLRIRGALRIILTQRTTIHSMRNSATHRNILQHRMRRIQTQIHQRERVTARRLIAITRQLTQIRRIHLITRINMTLHQRKITLIRRSEGRNLNLIQLRCLTIKMGILQQANRAGLERLHTERTRTHWVTRQLLIRTKKRRINNAKRLLRQNTRECQRRTRQRHHHRVTLRHHRRNQRQERLHHRGLSGIRLLRTLLIARMRSIRSARRSRCRSRRARGSSLRGTRRRSRRTRRRRLNRRRLHRRRINRTRLRHTKTPRKQRLSRHRQSSSTLTRSQRLPPLEILHHSIRSQRRTVTKMRLTQHKRMHQTVIRNRPLTT